jgi:hypothetical protein
MKILRDRGARSAVSWHVPTNCTRNLPFVIEEGKKRTCRLYLHQLHQYRQDMVEVIQHAPHEVLGHTRLDIGSPNIDHSGFLSRSLPLSCAVTQQVSDTGANDIHIEHPVKQQVKTP